MPDKKYITIEVEYGVGYGTHSTAIDVNEDATTDEIEEMVSDAVRERLWWTWAKPDDDEQEE